MKTIPRANRLLAVLLAALLGAGAALAQPPWAGGGGGGGGHGKHGGDGKHEAKGKKDDGGKGKHAGKDDGGKGKQAGKHAARAPQPGAYFSVQNRHAVQTYYASAGKGGKGCPPGLAKKNNGCMPPGQAKKQWNVGQPLPTTVVFHPVPQQIVVSLPPVPVGHRYVQVAGDVLLVAVGSMMVVDGINGLMKR